jgi:hypothetical protein
MKQDVTRLRSTRAGKYITRWLNFDSTQQQVQDALEGLDSIGKVNVTFTMGTSACNVGNSILVKFLTEMGNLPDIGVDLLDGLGNRQMATNHRLQVNVDGAGLSVMGSKASIECSGRGKCIRATGQCKCYQGYTSSDGDGRPGTSGDCGAVLQKVGDGVNGEFKEEYAR